MEIAIIIILSIWALVATGIAISTQREANRLLEEKYKDEK